MDNLDDALVMNLCELNRVMRSLYEGKGSQKRILIILGEEGGSMTQRKLTQRLGIQPGSASEVIAKLENAGCLSRSPSRTDGRTADIVLTPSGVAAAKEARAERMRRHQEMFSCLNHGEKEELLRLLERINQDWEERYQSPGGGLKKGVHSRKGPKGGMEDVEVH